MHLDNMLRLVEEIESAEMIKEFDEFPVFYFPTTIVCFLIKMI